MTGIFDKNVKYLAESIKKAIEETKWSYRKFHIKIAYYHADIKLLSLFSISEDFSSSFIKSSVVSIIRTFSELAFLNQF